MLFRSFPSHDMEDKWDIAQTAMDLANASKIAKSKGMKKPEQEQNKEPQKGEQQDKEPQNGE